MQKICLLCLCAAVGFAARSAESAGRPADPGSRGRERAAAHSPRVRAAVESRASLTARANARRPNLPATALNRIPDGVRSRVPGPQTNPGRFGRDLAAGRSGRSFDRVNDRLADRFGNLDAASRGRRGDDRGQAESATRRADETRGRREVRGMPRNRVERLLAKRLADIDRLRDVALKNGNTRLLERADELEALARRQHAVRTDGRTDDRGIGLGLFRPRNERPESETRAREYRPASPNLAR